MTLDRQSWPVSAWLVLALGLFSLAAGIIGNVSVLIRAGEPSIGTLYHWSTIKDCFVVHPMTPPNWPLIDQDRVRQSDCILSVDEIPFADREAITAHLNDRLNQPEAERFFTLQMRRDTFSYAIETAVVRLSLLNLLQAQTILIVIGVIAWLLGMVVLLALPAATANRSFAALAFTGVLLMMASQHEFRNAVLDISFTAITVVLGRPLMAVTLVHFALAFPLRSRLLNHRLVVFAIYAVTLTVLAITELQMAYLASGVPPWLIELTYLANIVTAAVAATGLGILLVRNGQLAFKARSRGIALQARLLLVATAIAIVPFASEFIFSQLRIDWLIPTATSLTFVFWVIPALALIAYAMLRYQSFAYRGQALRLLVVLFFSTVLALIYMWIVSPIGLDGVQFAVVWLAVLLTTLFFFLDTPFRRGFRRLFVRHEYDYEIANRFSHTIDTATTIDAVLPMAVMLYCDELETAWAAIHVQYRAGELWVKQAGNEEASAIETGEAPLRSLLPPHLVHAQWLWHAGERIGTIWLGERTTAEPFDKQDKQLVELLSQELSRALAVHAQIEDLEQVPGRILDAVERDRRRIGQDLHDGVLQFLGALPFAFDQTREQIESSPDLALATLERYSDRAELVSDETRAIIYDLSPPVLQRVGLVNECEIYAELTCDAADIQLIWLSNKNDDWNHLDVRYATHVYRILQEGISNATTHAQPDTITIEMRQDAGDLVLKITDDGQGFQQSAQPVQQGHLGLISMHERARVLGGNLTITNLDQGTELSLRFPAPSVG